MTWRILVAEDSRTQAEMVRADLEAAGYSVTLAGTGEEALDHLRAGRFDLVLSDVVMPGMGGYALCRRIRDDPALAAMPVVLLTSLTDPLELISALEAGADTFLRKPYDRDQLLARARGILERRQEPAVSGARGHLVVGDRRFTVTAERQQILQMLVSTFEDLVGANHDLRAREEELARAHAELRRQLRAVVLEQERLRTVVGSAPTPMLITDEHGTVTEASEPSAQLFGRPAAELVGARFSDVAALVDEQGRPATARQAAAMEQLRAGATVEYGGSFDTHVRRDDGTTTPVVVRSAPIQQEGQPYRGAVTLFREIGGLAYHDPVTKLANDSLFADRVALAASHLGDGRATAVLVVKLDRFDLVRQTLGHEASNAVLADAGARLAGLVRDEVVQAASRSASAGYLGGDELGLVLGGVAQEVDAVRVARRAIDAIGAAYDVGGIDATLTASVGVALDDEGVDAADVIRAAAAAAARAAGEGGGRVELFEPGIGERAAERLRLEADLRRGLAHGELVVHFQPEVHVAQGELTGAEALVRWQHPDRGLLMPSEFIPVAEETGLIVAVDRMVLGEACRQAAAWRRELPGGERFTVAVNLSARQLLHADLAAFVEATLDDTGLEPARLVLEITESAVTGDAPAAADTLRALRALGVGIAIDDFGTGYSSLLYLRGFPVDVLKIDRVFVDGMRSRSEDAAIVAGTVRLGHALGLHVVAEGVESEEQLVQLRFLDCDVAQGYLWSRPLPPARFAAWWAEQAAARRDRAGAHPSGVPSAPAEPDADARPDEVLADLIHELRSPLATMMGSTEVLARRLQGADPDVQGYLGRVQRNAEELDDILGRLTDARAVALGTMDLRLEHVDLGDLVAAVLADAAPETERHPVRLRADGGVSVTADRRRLAQALGNLVANAAKFSPAGAPIDVCVRASAGQATVAVRDRGAGIPDDRQRELFRRFSRLGSRSKGMGIGLHLARSISRAHGGDVVYEPAEPGSRFTLVLPARPDDPG